MSVILSILIRTVPERTEQFRALRDHLIQQMPDELMEFVEIISDATPRDQMSSGKKANLLMRKANGKYVVYIDDDDWVPDYYVTEMLKAAESDADCFAINGTMTTDGGSPITWRLSRLNDNVTVVENGREVYLRKTNHITAVKREIALQAGFPDKSNAEDKGYSDRLTPLCKTEYLILPPMYEYRFSTNNKLY